MKKENALLMVVLAMLIAFAAGRFSNHLQSQQAAQVAPHAVEPAAAVAGGDWAPSTVPHKGNPAALVTVIVSSDFQCPFCSKVEPTVNQLLKDYGNDIRIAWTNQPLPFHDRAKPAALAAMAAHKQGKFWEMHDKLFANNRELTDVNFEKWAQEVGCDLNKFKADLKDEKLAKQIDTEAAAANAVGASGTPSFFINGKLLQGAQPIEQFKTEVDAALAAAKKLQAAGKSGEALTEAAAAERDPQNGAKVVAYFLKGQAPAPAAAAAAAPGRPAPGDQPKADDGPAQIPPDAADLWKVPIDLKRDAIKGDNSKAIVTIVEFSDFQCPFCSRAAATVTQLEKDYGDKIRVVFKHTPLPFHPNAKPASLATIAAQKQGKFWEFYDKCFANQGTLTEENFQTWAKELGLNIDKFNADRKDPAAAKQIEDDQALGASVSVRGTPGFMINGHKIAGAMPIGVFKAVIDDEIKKAGNNKGQGYYDEVIAKGKVFSELGDKVVDIQVDGLPFKGPKDAKVTIVEFSDFQCPFCSRITDPIKLAQEARADKVKIVFAHYPLPFHQFAKPASIAAQEAWDEDPAKFWKVYEALFANQKDLSEDKIAAVAKEAGVDMAKLKAATDSKKWDKFLESTIEMGSKVGVEGTPTVFINGHKYEPANGYSAEGLGATIDKILKK